METYLIVNEDGELFAGFKYVSYANYVSVWCKHGSVKAMTEEEARQTVENISKEGRTSATVFKLTKAV